MAKETIKIGDEKAEEATTTEDVVENDVDKRDQPRFKEEEIEDKDFAKAGPLAALLVRKGVLSRVEIMEALAEK